MNRLIKKLILLSLSSILLISTVVIAVLWAFSNKLPDYKFLKSYKPPVSSKVYAGEGQLVSDFSKEKRIFVPYNAIPPKVINSFLSAEDKNFFSHPGVDAKSITRAIIKNLKNYFSEK